MITPTGRLLFCAALIFLPAATVLTAVPVAAPAAAAILGALVVVVITDAALSGRRLRGVSVQLLPLMRFTKDREQTIEIRLLNERQRASALRVALVLPSEIKSAEPDVVALLPADAAAARIDLACTPRKRGSFNLERVYLGAASPLGLWTRRRPFRVAAEVRVYPDLLSESGNVAALFLHRTGLGVRQFRQIGKGREFEKLRDYLSGDALNDIHWKATAKRGRPVTKVFQVERTQEVYVVVDSSRLSARNASGSQTLERFVKAALVLCLAARQQGDLFGLLTFADKVQRFVRAKNGRGHYDICRDALYALQPQIVTPDFADLFSFVRTRIRRRSLLVFLTALDDPALAESFSANIALLSRQHVVLVNMLQPLEARPLFTGEDPSSVDEIYQRLGGQILWHDLKELGKQLQRHGVELSLLKSERLIADLIAQYLRVKQRQLL